MTLSTHYIRYSDSVEVQQPDEQEISRKIVDSMARVNRLMYEKYRHAIRDAHAKSHAVLKGEITIYENLPEHLAQGLFAEPKTYPVIVRFSTAQGSIVPDKLSAFRGMAIKIIGVEGEKFLPELSDALTQDFLLVNYPIIPTGTINEYLKMQEGLESQAQSGELFQQIAQKAAVGVQNVMAAVGLADNTNKLSAPGPHILGDAYFSMAALRYGDYVAKINVKPLSENVKGLSGKKIESEIIDEDENAFLTKIIADFFRSNTAEYELSAQLCTDLEKMPVEDGSVQWPEDESPYQPVAKLAFPPQETFSPQRRVYADDVLSFNPFHCLPEHRPLGNIMRVRKLAYETSSRYRHHMNAQARLEPKSIVELPD
ncbi:catalase family protein [Flavobacterium sp. DG2-3]|uniref:catalase family protein n=1 Tax=Flavobacterium sp. DG2-3 TaxID=3068317 RepID=UPI00273DC1BD|nr:catalase family protein [Flavobacterium sp. DG2-3]MDP5200319.1 catalase family protein [Flavobacterium sp. DG2-3]